MMSLISKDAVKAAFDNADPDVMAFPAVRWTVF